MLNMPQIKSVVSKVSRKYGVKSAYLFGSYAKGNATDASDVDIIIEKGDIRGLALSRFRLDLMDELDGTKVDVLTKNSIRPKFYEMIKKRQDSNLWSIETYFY